MRVIDAARKYKGVKWRHLGRSRTGLDCAGLPIVAFADCGVILPDPKRYGRDPFQDGLSRALVAALGPPIWTGGKGGCHMSLLRVDDVVLMAPSNQPRHLAIVGDDPHHTFSICHADGTPGVGRVVEHGLSAYYMKMIVSVFRRSMP